MATRNLRCICGHEWSGLWDSHGQRPCPNPVCPACGSKLITLASQPAQNPDTANLFAVQRDGDDVLFEIPGMQGDKVFRLQGVLPIYQALNFAAHLAKAADPEGGQFERLAKEIQKL